MQENGHPGFWFFTELWPWMKVNVIQTKCHPNWYKNVKLSGLDHHRKFWKKLVCKCLNTSQCESFVWFVNVSVQVNVKVLLSKSYKKDSLTSILNRRNKIRMRFMTPVSLNTYPNSFQINWKLCQTIATEVFPFSHTCDLESSSRSMKLVWKCRVQQCLSPYQVWIKLSGECPNLCQR